jgi:hypothetical protein
MYPTLVKGDRMAAVAVLGARFGLLIECPSTNTDWNRLLDGTSRSAPSPASAGVVGCGPQRVLGGQLREFDAVGGSFQGIWPQPAPFGTEFARFYRAGE